MGIQHLVALGIDSAAKLIPKLEYSLGNNLDTIAGVATHEHATVMVHDFFLDLGQNIVNNVPIVIGIQNGGETGVGIDFGQQTLQKRNLIAVNRIVGTHDGMFSTGATKCNRLFGAVTVVHFL